MVWIASQPNWKQLSGQLLTWIHNLRWIEINEMEVKGLPGRNL